MLKPFSLSLGLALALGAYSVGTAGIFDKCTTCGIASPQSVVSPQGPVASAQGESCDTCSTCEVAKKKFCLKDLLPKPKPKMYTYTWVLKKKRVWGHKDAGCDTCETSAPVYASGQASPQIHPAPQAVVHPAAQAARLSFPGEMKPAVAIGDAVPPAPELPATASSSLFLTPSGN